MPDILESGQWQMLSLVDDGAIRISLVSAVAARLEVTGTSGPPKYLGPAHDVVAFPTGAVGDRGPVGVRVRSAAGEPFPGDGTVDLAVDSTGGGHSFLLKRVPVAGRISAPVLQLSRREGGIIARPGEGGGATTGLGGWCAKRRAEQGRPLRPTVTDVVIDTSSSMRRFAPRVEALTRFLNDLYVTAEVAGPTIHRAVIAGARNDGVGCVEAGPGGGALGRRRRGSAGARPALCQHPGQAGRGVRGDGGAAHAVSSPVARSRRPGGSGVLGGRRLAPLRHSGAAGGPREQTERRPGHAPGPSASCFLPSGLSPSVPEFHRLSRPRRPDGSAQPGRGLSPPARTFTDPGARCCQRH